MVPRNVQAESTAPVELCPLPLKYMRKRRTNQRARRNLCERLGNEPRCRETAGGNRGDTCKNRPLKSPCE